jgi:dipeptidyl aminopeptidase/acylaminoacyl peptidase
VSTPDPLPLDVVVSGRDLSEPRLSPDGRRVAFAHRWGGSAAISAVPTSGGGPERLLTFGPDPAPGRGSGGGCYAWLPDSDGVVYAARDGELWSVRDTTLRRLTHHARECRAPAIDARGEFVVHVVDEAQVWACSLVDGDAWRLDDGRHAFCFDPAVAPDGCTVSWLGWSPPHMPWDAAVRVDVRRRHGGRIDGGRTGDTRGADDLVITTWGPADGAVQQPRFAPDGTPTCVHDGTGWLVVHHGDHPVRDEPL